MQPIPPERQRLFQILLLTLAVIAMFFSFQPISQSQTDFYNNLWAPVHLLVQGENPYNTSSLHPDLPALWMPTAVGFFSALGFFSFDIAQQIWFLLNIAGLAALLYLSISEARTILVLLTSVLLAYFFPPAINHFALGQVSILSALCLFLSVKWIERMPWLSAFLLVLGMTKPQIGIFILFGVSIYQFRTGGFNGLVSYGLKAFLAALTLTLPLFIAEPKWIPDFIVSLQSNTPEWTHPSILSQLEIWIGGWAYLVWGSFLISMLWFITRLWKNNTPQIAALWTLAITVLVTPYVWSWDFVLILPLLVYVLSRVNWNGWFLLLVGYVLIWGGIAVIQLSDNFHNSRFWWVPVSYIGLVTFINLSASLNKITTGQAKGL